MNEPDYNSKENKLAVANALIDKLELQNKSRNSQSDQWYDSTVSDASYITSFLGGGGPCLFRVKPAPKTRLLGPEDVKPGCAFKRHIETSWSMIHNVTPIGFWITECMGNTCLIRWNEAATGFIKYPNTETFVPAVKEVVG